MRCRRGQRCRRDVRDARGCNQCIYGGSPGRAFFFKSLLKAKRIGGRHSPGLRSSLESVATSRLCAFRCFRVSAVVVEHLRLDSIIQRLVVVRVGVVAGSQACVQCVVAVFAAVLLAEKAAVGLVILRHHNNSIIILSPLKSSPPRARHATRTRRAARPRGFRSVLRAFMIMNSCTKC